MSPKWWFIVAAIAALTTQSSASIFGDLMKFDIFGALTGQSEGKNVPGREDDESLRGCKCQGIECNCCVDFNLTTIIDLGGPGCVQLKYLSQDEGVALNVSYGESLLHSKTVKKEDKKGSCMDLLSEFAQICAKFASLKETDEGGLQGCLHFEPHVLGEVTSQYHIGCFKMNKDGMVTDPSLAETEAQEETSSQSEGNEAASSSEDEDDETPSLLEVVNQGAEQGIAFFTDLLGLKTPSKKNKTTTTTEKTDEATEAQEEAEDEDEEEGEEESRGFPSLRKSLRQKYLGNNV